MTEYKTKSAIIGRKRDRETGLLGAFVALFDMNDPHKSGNPPRKVLEFKGARNVRISGCEIKYMIPGNDLILNDLESLDIREENGRVYVVAKSSKK